MTCIYCQQRLKKLKTLKKLKMSRNSYDFLKHDLLLYHTLKLPDSPDLPDNICWDWAMGKICKYYHSETCNYEHPQKWWNTVCKYWCSSGCSDNECKYLHVEALKNYQYSQKYQKYKKYKS